MTYGQELGLFAGNGPLIQPVRRIAPATSARNYAAWRNLDAERRLALVEIALATPANDDHEDGFPAAL